MKTIVNAFKNPATRKAALLFVANGLVTYFIYSEGFHCGLFNGGQKVMDTAERMTPGFTEQFQKFVSAEHYGWKS